MRSLLLSIASLGSTLLATSAGASVVTSNLGETQFGNNLTEGVARIGQAQSTANRFTAGTGTWSIDGITVKVRDLASATPDNYQLQIRNDASGTPGSSVLGSLNMSTNDIGGSFAEYAYAPSAPLTLTGGSYWLVAIPLADTTMVQWTNTASTAHAGVSGWSIDDRQWTATDATGTVWTRDPAQLRHQFSVAATLVPEPTSLAALALSTLVLKRRRSFC